VSDERSNEANVHTNALGRHKTHLKWLG